MEAKLKESQIIHGRNSARYEEEVERVARDIQTVKQTLNKRLLDLSQLEEIDVEGLEDLEQLDYLTRIYCD